MTERKLMATFVKKSMIKDFLEFLHKNKITNKVFILSGNQPAIYIVTYNLEKSFDLSNLKPVGGLNTINIQREKASNSLYTINALNIILENIKMITEQEKKNIVIDWNKYKNCLLTTSDKQLITIKTRLIKIFYLNDTFNIKKVFLK
jgi:hypothetical protein